MKHRGNCAITVACPHSTAEVCSECNQTVCTACDEVME